jgi:hypothetical protein
VSFGIIVSLNELSKKDLALIAEYVECLESGESPLKRNVGDYMKPLGKS